MAFKLLQILFEEAKLPKKLWLPPILNEFQQRSTPLWQRRSQVFLWKGCLSPIIEPGLVQEDHCLSQVGGALHRLVQSVLACSSQWQEPPCPHILSTCWPEPRRSRTRCGSMAIPPAGTRRTSRSDSAGAASARGLSGPSLHQL